VKGCGKVEVMGWMSLFDSIKMFASILYTGIISILGNETKMRLG